METEVEMLINNPNTVIVFGANHSGINSTTYLQNGCKTTSDIDDPWALYLCSDNLCSCNLQSMLELPISLFDH